VRVAIVMPRGGTMCRSTANSMETVAHTLREHSRMKANTSVICDAGAKTPLTGDLITVPAGLGKAQRARAVAKMLRTVNPDIIEYHQQLESAASLARAFPDKINVLYRHTRIRPPGDPISRLRYGARLTAFDRLVFVSDAARAEFLGDYPELADRATAISNPIDSAAWSGNPDRRENLILFSGRATEEKGLEPFCVALANVLDRSPDWRGALMLGDWDRHRAWAEPVVGRLARFGDRVEIHKSAPLSAVISVTRRAAIAVTPSFVAEALGLTALEAHAAGAALISSGRGGLREASGPCAIYVDPPEAEGIALAMDQLIQDAPGRAVLARHGQERVARLHSAERRSRQLDELREGLTTQPKPVTARHAVGMGRILSAVAGLVNGGN
jgi:glycosyltransferase involved in cell wall biosynthesis